jgi:orotate phosphoribosyltransferase
MGLLIKEKFPAANRVIGVAMAGIPISVAVSLENGIPGSYTRKLEGVKSVEELNDRIKSYGEHSLIEGEIFEGDHIVVVDDLVTGFGSKEIAIEQIQREIERRKLKGIRILGVAVIIDREQGARQAALKKQIQLEALIPFKSRGVDWLKGVMSTGEIEIISQYLEDPEKFQKGNFRDYVKNQMS